ncbi:MAG TPA: class I SAM-dependent DNA methyltransferase [Brevundimonas sp.]|uniref:class I SAM-dependent DNA methyltransferase n=1 Tax=Brevundimonas aurantiaca TaxID=74316 RepID=UPI000C98FF7E|nr:SAM-dependent methyltransferase [Brevundimonas sp.]HAF81924.1 class I SAM-dependent DNA methyltransferase [Brevundimonas sp.]
MNAADFIAKWSDATLRERQGSQMHFLDLCALLDQPQPTDPDRYCFERGATKAGGDDGWADVWRRGCFAWEYKGPHKDLDKAFRQLATYVSDLENPPYLVTSDMSRIVVRTNFTNTVTAVYEFALDDLRDPAKRDLLRQIFEGSEKLKPTVSPQELTAKAVERFAELGRRLQDRRTKDDRPLHDPRAIAHFLNQLVFCMFAEDARLLPDKLFTKTLRGVQTHPVRAQKALASLFNAMASEEEDDRFFLGVGVINWFNGGLFDGAEPLLLEAPDLKLVADTADEHDWSEIDPAIFGTMFEEALKATRKRAALGAHYTDRAKILKIVDPVIVWPLEAEWAAARSDIAAAAEEARAAAARRQAIFDEAGEALKAGKGKGDEAKRRKAVTQAEKDRTLALNRARDRLEAFLQRLSAYRVLDPACGSGNFLYVALHALKDIELKALIEAERLTGLQSPGPRVTLDAVRGIEIEPYAAELARVTLWIGDLQWSLKNGYRNWPKPILAKLDQIENRDALLNPDGSEAEWPTVDAIIGNPPFLGDRKMIADIGEDYVTQLRKTFKGRVPGGSDFVTYWVEKAWREVSPNPPPSGEVARRPSRRDGGGSTQTPNPGQAPSTASRSIGSPNGGGMKRAGFVTTNSIRGGASRKVLDPIADAGAIWEAWADEPWVLQGAAVRVSMLAFGHGFAERRLNGTVVADINADLTSSEVDLTDAVRLPENADVAFIGTMKNGPFNVSGEQARAWLVLPRNPNGKSNSAVLAPWTNGRDISARSSEQWIVDFGPKSTLAAASLFEAPFEHVLKHVKPLRDHLRRKAYRELWWRYQEPQQKLRSSIAKLDRYIGSPRVAKYRLFRWLHSSVVPDSAIVGIARDDDTTFGILHSRFHELWSLRMGTWLGVGNDPRYTPSTTFETFPFPKGLTPNIPAADYAEDPRAVAIAEAARDLNAKREAWLNPVDLVRIEPEVVPGYPDRILPVSDDAAKVLKTRTLTNLYNQRPEWLDMAHRRLDAAVAAAYGWPADLTDDQVLEHLFALNQERAAAGR